MGIELLPFECWVEVLRHIGDVEFIDQEVPKVSKWFRQIVRASLSPESPTTAVSIVAADPNKNTLLTKAAEKGLSTHVSILLAAGAGDVAWKSAQLQSASEDGRLEMVESLIAAGADLHDDDDEALVLAATAGHAQVVNVLIAAGADVDAQGGAALLNAVDNNMTEVVRVLLEADACTNASALVMACKKGNLEIVELLLDAGADVRAHSYEAVRAALRHRPVNAQLMNMLAMAMLDN